MKPSYEELERYGRQADITIENLERKVEQLAAENAALKSAFDKPDAWLSWHSIPPTFYEPDRGGEYLQVHEKAGEKNDDGSDSWPVYRKPETETPATDAILAEVRASGVDYAIGVIKGCANNLCPGGTGEAVQYAQEMVTPYLDSIHDKLADKSAQLRQEAK